MKVHFTYLIALLITWISSFCCWSAEPQNCGYQSCPVMKPDMLNVHIMPHTHDDVGWLKTFDQYYYGSATNIARAGVQYILDSVLGELLVNPNRRFIYVETAFFIRWWDSLDDKRRQLVSRLVQSGQLEFIGGGWCMNDEAAAHYNDIIDQMTLGLRTLRGIFGKCGIPKVAWQIDPFGHSREQASLFAQMGFDGLFFGRLDYQDKDQRLETKQMEFLWNTSSSLNGRVGNLFTGALYNNYSPPPGFCFDLLCNDDPIIDDKSLPDYNVDVKVTAFLHYVNVQAQHFLTNNIPVTMGNDFNYQQAGSWFKNLDKLIYYVNAMQSEGSKVNLVYSTPSCYLKSLNDAKATWPTKRDDFFPYASDPHAYWTGYFTSRPALKGYIRQTNNFLQICKQFDALTSLMRSRRTSVADVKYLKKAQAVAQHHDAVTGTSKQAVQDDYVRLLSEGVHHCQKVISDSYQVVASKGSETPPVQVFCTKLNVSECHVTENFAQFDVTAFNPYARPVTHSFRIPVTGRSYIVKDSAGVVLDSQLVPIPPSVKNQPERDSKADMELVFLGNLPALGYSTFFVKTGNFLHTELSQKSTARKLFLEDVVINSDFMEATIDGSTGLLKKLKNLETGKSLAVKQNFYWYRAMSGSNTGFTDRASGAYIFRPNGSEPESLADSVIAYAFKGPVVSEVHQIFSSWITQVIRLYTNSRHLEMEWLVGPIPIRDKLGKEIISRFSTPLMTEGAYFTDANGREILKRNRDFRPTWHLNRTEPVSGNYYPVNSRIYIKDATRDSQLTVLTDRSVGGASLVDGTLEIMVHRRLLKDDGFGVDEPLNEPGFDGKGLVVRGKTMLLLTDVTSAPIAHRDLAQRLFMAPIVTFSENQYSPEEWNNRFYSTLSGLNQPLPPNVHLLTLETLKPPYLLLRLEHFFERWDDPRNLSQSVTVDLQNLFTPFRITSVNETMLAADRLTKFAGQFDWLTDDNSIPEMGSTKEFVSHGQYNVTLAPMQIRTFIVTVQ